MKLLKISKNHQITIPKLYHNLCKSGYFALNVFKNTITLKPFEPILKKSLKEELDELLKKHSRNPS